MQLPSLSPTSPPFVPHEATIASPTSPNPSLTSIATTIIETRPYVVSEMSCLSEHDILLQKSKDTPPHTPCNIVSEESPLLTVKSPLYDNVSICDCLSVHKL